MQPTSNTPQPARLRSLKLYRLEAEIRRAAWASVRAQVASLVARFRTRQTIRELNILSDRQLRDLGLLRAEIGEAAAKSAASRA